MVKLGFLQCHGLPVWLNSNSLPPYLSCLFFLSCLLSTLSSSSGPKTRWQRGKEGSVLVRYDLIHLLLQVLPFPHLYPSPEQQIGAQMITIGHAWKAKLYFVPSLQLISLSLKAIHVEKNKPNERQVLIMVTVITPF